MILTAQEDIEAPIDRVFAELSDFDGIERQAMRRGVQVQRRGSVDAPVAAGTAWEVGFTFRGKTRDAVITLTDCIPSEKLVFDTVSGGLEAQAVVDCVALSRGRTRISLHSELIPKTLSARLLVQSLKLAKGGVEKRFRRRMAGFAKDLETRLKSAG
jgi:uncharacterized protein YndB with AHSA1/START domain